MDVQPNTNSIRNPCTFLQGPDFEEDWPDVPVYIRKKDLELTNYIMER
jgi:hypothetical protein